MGPVKLNKLISAISENRIVEWDNGSLLTASSSPSPYVRPKFRILHSSASGATSAEKLAVEVIFVQAPAAVGKSITAKHLSSSLNAPILDLATVGIGGASLDGLLGRSAHYDGRRDRTRAVDDFHNGDLPVIVDALDEGQMVSGQTAFEAFLESTAELVLENRAIKDRPKIVFFGRPEATDLSDAAVQIAGDEDITSCVVDLEFFSNIEAIQLIKAYATTAIEEMTETKGEISSRRTSAYDDLIKWYFKRIEDALQIPEGKLWEDSIGKPFAGYAPVLAAIGRLLAEIEQPHVAINELQKDGRETAWSVIEQVMQYILERERNKVVEPLVSRFGNSLDETALARAYDPYEQLAYLAQLLQGQTITSTGNAQFSMPLHNQTYIENVRNFCGDHPFIRRGVAANDVFESFILTNAIDSSILFGEVAWGRLEYLSRHPFLWRCFWHHEQMTEARELPLDGKYVGFLLRSYCNDPLTDKRSDIQIIEDAGRIRIVGSKPEEDGSRTNIFEFEATAPLQLFGSINNCSVDFGLANLEIVGDSKKGDSPSFLFLGENSIMCNTVEISSDRIVIHGSLLIETVEVGPPNPKLKLSVEKGRLGSDGAISNMPPWNDWAVERDAQAIIAIPETARQAFYIIRKIEANLGSIHLFTRTAAIKLMKMTIL